MSVNQNPEERKVKVKSRLPVVAITAVAVFFAMLLSVCLLAIIFDSHRDQYNSNCCCYHQTYKSTPKAIYKNECSSPILGGEENKYGGLGKGAKEADKSTLVVPDPKILFDEDFRCEDRKEGVVSIPASIALIAPLAAFIFRSNS